MMRRPHDIGLGQSTAERIDRAIRLEDAARLYRFVSGFASVEDCEATRMGDVVGLLNAPTFDTFLDRNRMRVYEEVIR